MYCCFSTAVYDPPENWVSSKNDRYTQVKLAIHDSEYIKVKRAFSNYMPSKHIKRVRMHYNRSISFQALLVKKFNYTEQYIEIMKGNRACQI